jgi:hypothetical protein
MKHIIFSPHSDDAVLCCGGMMAKFIGAGDTVIYHTIFCALPKPPYSPLATVFHEKWGNPDNVVRLRRAEDEAAAAKLGAELVYGPMFEPLYRAGKEGQWMYHTVEDIFGPRHPDDNGLVPQLIDYVSAVGGLAESRLYFPLGIGRHVDHLIVFEVGQHFLELGLEVVFYEDFPYTIQGEKFAERMAHLPTFQAEVVELSQAQLNFKVEAFGYYRSQIPMLFKDFDRVPGIFLDFARSVGGDGRTLGERLWHDPASPGAGGGTAEIWQR